jgi:hypothetical protein
MRSSSSDYEIAIPLFEIDSLVRGTGYYEGLPDHIREGQIARFAALHDQLYPSLRVFLFDARRLHSAPLTVFGPLLAVIYVGQHYLAFRDTERVRALTLHFDRLVREARIPARDLPAHLAARLAEARAELPPALRRHHEAAHVVAVEVEHLPRRLEPVGRHRGLPVQDPPGAPRRHAHHRAAVVLGHPEHPVGRRDEGHRVEGYREPPGPGQLRAALDPARLAADAAGVDDAQRPVRRTA